MTRRPNGAKEKSKALIKETAAELGTTEAIAQQVLVDMTVPVRPGQGVPDLDVIANKWDVERKKLSVLKKTKGTDLYAVREAMTEQAAIMLNVAQGKLIDRLNDAEMVQKTGIRDLAAAVKALGDSFVLLQDGKPPEKEKATFTPNDVMAMLQAAREEVKTVAGRTLE